MLSEVLYRRRKELNLSLQDVARKLDVADSTVQRWASGKIRAMKYSHVIKLAEVLDVPLLELLDSSLNYTGKMPTSVESAKTDNAITEAAFNLFRQLPINEQQTIFSVIRSIADKYNLNGE
mgnify:CR=1 FL=1